MNKKVLIGIIVLAVILLVVGTFLFIKDYDKNNSVKNTTISKIINPASVYCVHQGHKVDVRSGENGTVSYCLASDGQECEEWAYYRGECSFKGFANCVPASCCHASSCVLENNAPNCSNLLCTMVCEPGTMDCGGGYCGIVNGKCGVVWNEK